MADQPSRSRERKASKSRDRDQPTREPFEAPENLKSNNTRKTADKFEPLTRPNKQAVALKTYEPDDEDDLELSAEEEQAIEEGAEEQEDQPQEESNTDGLEEQQAEEEQDQEDPVHWGEKLQVVSSFVFYLPIMKTPRKYLLRFCVEFC